MAGFVPSVERVQRSKDGSDETVEAETQHTPSPSYAFGSRGAAALRVEGKRWTWRWMMAKPSRWNVSEPWQSFPMFHGQRRLPITAAKSLSVPSVMAVSVVEPPTRLASGPNRREAEPALASGPHAGETAVFVSLDSRRGLRQLSQVLVYACGTRESRLGVIPLWPESQTHNAGLRDDDRGGSHSVDTYNSPILQIASSPYLSGRRVDGGATSMVVRLENTTHLINLYANPEFSVASSSPPILVTRVAELDRRLTDGLRHVDVAIDPREWSRVAIVDEGGGVWLWWEEKELVKHRLAKLTKLAKLRGPVSDATDDFFRVAFGVRPDTLLVLSRSSIVEIDTSPALTSNPRFTTLLSLQDPSESFTAIERSASLRGSGITYVCTTKSVMWIAPSGTRSPVLRWCHELGGDQDQDLRLVVASSTASPAAVGGDTVLVYQPSSGRAHGALVSDHGLAALISEPWVLPVPQSGGINTLTALVFNPSKSSKHGEADGEVMLVSAGKDTFSVCKLSTSHPLPFDRESSPPNGLTDGIPSLVNGRYTARVVGSAASSKDLIIPARWAWLSINDETASPLLDLAACKEYLKDPEGRLDTVTTRAELVRAAAYCDPSTTRSHVLRGVNYQESFSASDIASVPLSSHFAFSATSGTLLGDGVKELTATSPKLHEEAELEPATRRLYNDLQLSSKIVYPIDPRWPQAAEARCPTVDDLFAEAAGKLSLDESAPSLSFAVLPPPHTASLGAAEQGWTPVPSSQDVRTAHALLHDWKLGTSPQHYQWKPSRSSSSPTTSPPRRGHNAPPGRRFPSQPFSQLGGRPVSPLPRYHPQSSPVRRNITVQVTTESRHSPTTGRTPSSPTALSDPDTFPKTQIERGTYGARPEAAAKALKKKATKRRHGF